MTELRRDQAITARQMGNYTDATPTSRTNDTHLERRCHHCNARLRQGNPGPLCTPCTTAGHEPPPTATATRFCLHCHIPIDRGANARYCSTRCTQLAYYQRRRRQRPSRAA